MLLHSREERSRGYDVTVIIRFLIPVLLLVDKTALWFLSLVLSHSSITWYSVFEILQSQLVFYVIVQLR